MQVDYGADDSKASSPELPPGVSPVYTIDTSAGTIRGVEAEFAVVLGKTLTPIEDVAFTIPEVGRRSSQRQSVRFCHCSRFALGAVCVRCRAPSMRLCL